MWKTVIAFLLFGVLSKYVESKAASDRDNTAAIEPSPIIAASLLNVTDSLINVTESLLNVTEDLPGIGIVGLTTMMHLSSPNVTQSSITFKSTPSTIAEPEKTTKHLEKSTIETPKLPKTTSTTSDHRNDPDQTNLNSAMASSTPTA